MFVIGDFVEAPGEDSGCTFVDCPKGVVEYDEMRRDFLIGSFSLGIRYM